MENRSSRSKTLYKTEDGLVVKVYQGDIRHTCVDGIVSSTDKALSNAVGVAKVIAAAAGKKLKRECSDYISKKKMLKDGEVFVSSAGDLPYKFVIHVSPIGSGKCFEMIRKVVFNVLVEACSLNLQSVAIPAIFSGFTGVSKDFCALEYLEGVLEFSSKFMNQRCFKEVHFVDIDRKVCNAINDCFRQSAKMRISDSQHPICSISEVSLDNTLRMQHRSYSSVAAAADDDVTGGCLPQAFETTEGLIVKVYKGDIVRLNVSGIVSSSGPDLTKCFGVAKAIADAAGDKLKQELKHCRNLRTGEIFLTSAGNLPYDYILHINVFLLESGGFMLEDAVLNLLMMASRHKLHSVALPALGSSDKNYASEYLQDVLRFSSKLKNLNQSLQEVHFVDINPHTCRSIQSCFSKTYKLKPRSSPDYVSQTGSSNTNWAKPSAAKTENGNERENLNNAFSAVSLHASGDEFFTETFQPKTNLNIFKTKTGLTIKVYVGDITKLNVDGIVNAANSQLQHFGGVAYTIAKAAGWRLEKECEQHVRLNGPLQEGEVFMSSAGDLSYKYVLHTVGPVWKGNPDYCLQMIAMAVSTSLMKADSYGLCSVALPAISSKIYGVPKAVCVSGYLAGVLRFSNSNKNKHNLVLGEVHFVDIDRDMCKTIASHFSQSHELNIVDHQISSLGQKAGDFGTHITQKIDNSEQLMEVEDLSSLLRVEPSGGKSLEAGVHSCTITLGRFRVLVYAADALELKVDAVLWPRNQKAAEQLRSKVGETYYGEYTNLCRVHEHNVFHLRPCSTSQVTMIFFLTVNLEWQIKMALTCADNLGMESVALIVFPEDIIGIPEMDFVKLIFHVLKCSYFSFTEIHVVNELSKITEYILQFRELDS